VITPVLAMPWPVAATCTFESNGNLKCQIRRFHDGEDEMYLEENHG
jgi:hypothetical protein